jgi:hypothetical protein
MAGGIMWAGGDAAFLIAMIVALWIWLRAEEVAGKLADEKLDREDALRTRLAPASSPPAQAPGD